MNKKIIYGLMLPLLAVTLVLAVGYIVNTLTLNIGVKEPFQVEYAILGDGGTYIPGTDTCEGATYYSNSDIEIGQGTESDTMLPGQSRFICVEIENEAGALPYEITASIDGGDLANTQLCIAAFGGPYTISGTANAGDNVENAFTYDGFEVIVPSDAPEVTGCIATIDVLRG